MNELNENEIKVLNSLIQSSADNGHDFGFTDEWQNCGLAPNQMAGYIGQLSKKGYLDMEDLSEDPGVESNAVQFFFTRKAERFLNVYNSNTPGYKKVYVDYNHREDEMI